MTCPYLDHNDNLSEFGRIECITCHDPHRWSSESNRATYKNISSTISYWAFYCVKTRSYAPSHCSPWGMLPGFQPIDLSLSEEIAGSWGVHNNYIFEANDIIIKQEGTAQTSFLRRSKIGGSFCVDCHGLEARMKYKYFHDKQGREKGLDYIK